MSSKSKVWLVGSVILLAILWRMSVVIWDVISFETDEAIVGLMAKHILLGERPVFYYGQFYMGSLDAFLVSLGFLLFGQKVWVIRLVQTLLFGGTIFFAIKTGEEAFRSIKIGLVAGLLLAIPTVSLLLYSTASLGGYGEALFFSSVLLFLALRMRKQLTAETIEQGRVIALSAILGVAGGLAFWADNLTAIVTLPCILFVLFYLFKANALKSKRWISFGVLVLGFFMGITPIWISMIQNGFVNVLKDLSGGMYMVESGSTVQRILNHIFNFFFLGLPSLFGIRPPWSVQLLAIPVLPLIIVIYAGVILWTVVVAAKKPATKGLYTLFAGIIILFFLLFIFTPFGIDPTGRYFVPINIITSLLIANFITTIKIKKWMAIGITGIILVFNVWGTLQSALKNPPGITFHPDSSYRLNHLDDQKLISFLEENQINAGYTNYWLSYLLAFQSDEQLIFLPKLPYHSNLIVSTRDDRYKPYDEIVEKTQNVAYITYQLPALDEELRNSFNMLAIKWKEAEIGDYRVFYALSQKVSPDKLGIKSE